MLNTKWVNFFVTDLHARGITGHIPAEQLPQYISNHDGREAYHCAFELNHAELKCEEDTGQKDAKGKPIYRYHSQTPETISRWALSFNRYDGIVRPAMGYAYFDFDSSDGGASAFIDAIGFIRLLGTSNIAKYFYSGSKGFHIAIPLGAFGLSPSNKLPSQLNFVAHHFKKEFKTLDTSVYNAQRKFRALGSRHPKTGLFKIELTLTQFTTLSLDQIKELAKTRGALTMNEAPACEPIEALSSVAALFTVDVNDSISFKEFSRYKKPEGTRAFDECEFLKHCKENPGKISEPEWYAAASIVGRMEDGRTKFQAMSKGHPHYSVAATNDKLDQALGSAGPRTCKGIQALWGKCFECKHFEKIKSPIVILDKEVIGTESAGFHFHELIETGAKAGSIKYVPDYNGLVRAFRRDFKYFIDATSEMIYAWNGTNYRVITKLEVKAWCEEVMTPEPSMKVSNEFYDKILRNHVVSSEDADHLFHETIKEKLNLRNGVYHIADGVLAPHDPATGFRYTLPYDYDPQAKCPTFDKFMDDVTCGRADLKKTLIEFMAYTLHSGYEDHCFLWLAGGGRNGKSTFLDLLRDLVGTKATQAVMLASFEKEFSLQTMDGMLLNVSEESDSMRLSPAVLGNLKALSSGSLIQVQKKQGHPYSMKPTAKLAFAANKPPSLSGTEDALKSRMIVVPFDLNLEDHGATETTSRIDWKLKDKLREELPGILNVVLSALQDFLKRSPRKIYRSATSHDAMNEIMKDSDSIERFVQEELRFDDKTKSMTAEELFTAFDQWIGPKNDPREWRPDLSFFVKALKAKLRSKCEITTPRSKNKRTTLFSGISLQNHIEF